MKDSLYLVASWAYSLATNRLVLLALGGAAGTVLRYLIGRWAGDLAWAKGFPVGTMLINVSGSFILGMVAVVILERLPVEYQDWYLLVGTGFCGGYTTFSTFEWETYKLIRDGSVRLALANVVGSVVLGFLGVYLAVILARLISPRP